MVKPGLSFFGPAPSGCSRSGAVLANLVDPGLGIKGIGGDCLAEAQPEAFIGIPKAQIARRSSSWGQEDDPGPVDHDQSRLAGAGWLTNCYEILRCWIVSSPRTRRPPSWCQTTFTKRPPSSSPAAAPASR